MPSNTYEYMHDYYMQNAAYLSAYAAFRRERNQKANGERMRPARSARLWAGFTQAEVAQCLGVTQSTYNCYETGASAYPLDTILRAIAHMARISVEALAEESKGYNEPLPRKGKRACGRLVIDPTWRTLCAATEKRAGRLPSLQENGEHCLPLRTEKAAGAVAAAPTAGALR